ncbi:hypothetical protein FB45DRAFT_340277 [Roridomyces roridus]|uniref:Uncharacterized protein n=1 Tax=Roridomyces roridus TaxID=1738132 RepID=A0AAD7B4K6_9AGAR|nr:hypothetical protein FB45DRAFT_340277 [Roridomyces roridus]
MPNYYSYSSPSPAVLTQPRTQTTSTPRQASGGKTFGRPVDRLRSSVVRGARKWQRRLSAGGFKGHEENERPSSVECIPLLAMDQGEPGVTPSVRWDVAPPSIHSTQRTLRRIKSGFFRPPRSRRWRRTRKFAKFILRILAAIATFPGPPIIYHPDYC